MHDHVYVKIGVFDTSAHMLKIFEVQLRYSCGFSTTFREISLISQRSKTATKLKPAAEVSNPIFKRLTCRV